MKIIYLLPIVLMCISCHTTSKESNIHQLEDLKKEISTVFNEVGGDFALSFRDLQSGDRIDIQSDTVFHAASTMKTPVMIEVFQQAAQGLISLEDSVIIFNQFKSIVDGSEYSLDSANDSELELYKKIGEKTSWYQLMYEMIISSSNLATNIIIEKINAKKVTETIHKMGAIQTLVLRGVEDQKAFDKGLNNVTTSADQAILYEHIAKGEAVSADASKKMMEILFNQEHNDIIPALLPKNVKVAHKTGSITGVRHDAGIVFLPNGKKYVLVLLTKKLEDEKAAIAAMAKVSKMIYDFVQKK